MASTHCRDICDGHHRRFDWCAYPQEQQLKMVQIQRRRRDMCNRSWIYALPLTVLFALLATTSHAQEAIGKATSVRPQAEGSHGNRTLSGGASVYSQETVRTGDSGQADLQFRDNSSLSVGSKSSVRLDKFVYDPNKSGGAVAIQATRGTFRFVTGSQGGSYQIKSPYGTLGIRG
jgi:FecR protein